MTSTSLRPDIQGLRAIAVLAVIAFHFNPAWLPGGFIGVDVFLVISGFLITTILLNKKAQPNYSLCGTLRYFYTSRFKRIAPAYFVMLVLVALASAVFFLPKDFNTFKDGAETAAWFNSNHYFADFGDYFAPANHEQPLLHTWSLAVEMQFYVLAPFLVLLLPVNALKWTLAALLIILTAVAEYRLRVMGMEQATYYSLYARLPEFFAGALAALYVRASPTVNKTSWHATLGLALVVLSACIQPLFGAFPGTAALLPVLGSVLILAWPPPQGMITRLLCNNTLLWVGALSYSLYLWHWPVLAFLRYYSGAEVLSLELSTVFVVLVLGLSLASYYGIEQTFRRRQSGHRHWVRWGLLLATVFGTHQAMAKVNEHFTPEQLPTEYRRYADRDKICHGKVVDNCLRGDVSSDRQVLVLGDSHAAMLNHFFDYLGQKLGFEARIITASSCVTIPEFDYNRLPEWAHEPCVSQIEFASQHLKSANPLFIAASWNWQVNGGGFRKRLVAFLSKASEDRNIYLLSQVPLLQESPHRARRFNTIGLPTEPKLDTDYRRTNQMLSEISIEIAGVNYVDLANLPMFRNAPFYQNSLMYMDSHHLSKKGAKEYARQAKFYFGSIIEPFKESLEKPPDLRQ